MQSNYLLHFIFLFDYSKFKRISNNTEDGDVQALHKEYSSGYLRMFTLEVRMHLNLSLYALRLISSAQSPTLPAYFTFTEDCLQKPYLSHFVFHRSKNLTQSMNHLSEFSVRTRSSKTKGNIDYYFQ